MEEEEDGKSEPLVRVQFLTDQERYRVTETSIAVPTRLSRRGLSEVINHLLSLDPSIPFDFLHLDTQKLVRISLEKFLVSEGISKETVVKLKYAPALPEPESKASETTDDWIASVDSKRCFESANDLSCVVVASYDGTLQLHSLDSNGKLVSLETISAHRGSTKCVSQCLVGDHFIASGGSDGQVKIWSVDDSKSLGLRAQCVGHRNKVETVSAVNVGSHVVVASGGWDRSVCLWKVNMESNDLTENGNEKTTMKKRKISGTEKETLIKLDSPSCAMNEHTDNVSAIVWGGELNPVTLYSGSWDHSLRSWDVTRECCTATLNGNKVVTSLSFSESSQMLASGHADNTVRLWDARAHGDSIVKFELCSHKKWVSDLAWSKTNEHLLVSVSHDNTVKLWDIRSKIPLYSLTPHTSKVLCVDWNHNCKQIVSGGADSKIEVQSLNN